MTPQQIKDYLPPVLARMIDLLAGWWMGFAAAAGVDDFDAQFPEIDAADDQA